MRSVIWLVLLFVAAVVAATTLGPQRRAGQPVLERLAAGRVAEPVRHRPGAGLPGPAADDACMLQSLVSLPERAHEWRVQRRERAAQAALREALAEYFGARYSRARKAASRAVAIHDATPELVSDLQTRTLAHLLWAASLHRLQDRPQRDRQLAQLQRLRRHVGLMQRGKDDGVPLMAAEWALDDRDAARALSLLADLPPGVARRTQALRLKLQAQRLAGQTDRRAAHRAPAGQAPGILERRSASPAALAGGRDIGRGARRRATRPRLAGARQRRPCRPDDRCPRRHLRRAPGRARPRPAMAAARVAAPGRARLATNAMPSRWH